MYRCLGRPFSSGSGFLRESRTLGSRRFSKAIAVKVGMAATGRILIHLGLGAMKRERDGEKVGFREGKEDWKSRKRKR